MAGRGLAPRGRRHGLTAWAVRLPKADSPTTRPMAITTRPALRGNMYSSPGTTHDLRHCSGLSASQLLNNTQSCVRQCESRDTPSVAQVAGTGTLTRLPLHPTSGTPSKQHAGTNRTDVTFRSKERALGGSDMAAGVRKDFPGETHAARMRSRGGGHGRPSPRAQGSGGQAQCEMVVVGTHRACLNENRCLVLAPTPGSDVSMTPSPASTSLPWPPCGAGACGGKRALAVRGGGSVTAGARHIP